jgi:hypothetical protein
MTLHQSWHDLRLIESYGQTMSVGYALVEPVQQSLINWHLDEVEEQQSRPSTADGACARRV